MCENLLPMSVVFVSAILALTMVLLITERVPVELTALGIIVTLSVFGVLPIKEAIAGFSHPAPVTVAALFVVSAGLERTGALGFLARRLATATEGRPRMLLLLVLGVSAPLSAFVNNTPVVVLMISVILAACDHQGLSPSKFLIPLSFISILAGTATLIGTSTNIIISDLAAQAGQEAIGMFELTPLGAPITLAGALVLLALAFKLLPEHKTPVLDGSAAGSRLYIAELTVPPLSPLIGQEARGPLCKVCPELTVYEVIREMVVLYPDEQPVILQEGDLLLVKAPAGELVRVLDDKLALAAAVEGCGGTSLPPERASIVELIVTPSSRFIGRRWRDTSLAQEPHIHCIGLQRQWVHYPSQDLGGLRLAVGDILLVQCPPDHLEQLRATGDVIVVEDLQPARIKRRRAPVAAVLFAAMVVVAATGVADILVAALTAAVLMIATGCLSLPTAYRALDPRTLLLIVGTIALGRALEQTGAAALYAQTFLGAFSGASPPIILGGFIAFTSLLSHFLSNNSTAVLMTPIALSVAGSLGVSARPFIIGLCFGASASFATPVGYQTNLLVYGPGGYRFVDYVRLGLPLDLIVVLGAALAIPLRWPF